METVNRKVEAVDNQAKQVLKVLQEKMMPLISRLHAYQQEQQQQQQRQTGGSSERTLTATEMEPVTALFSTLAVQLGDLYAKMQDAEFPMKIVVPKGVPDADMPQPMAVLSRLVAEDERNPLFVRDAALASNDSTNPLSQEETEALQTLLAAHKDSLESLLDQLKDELSQKLAPRVKAHRDQRSQEIAALKERMKMLEMKRRTLHLQPPPSSNSSSSSNNRASASASTAAVSSSSISVLGKRPANN